MCDFPFKKDGVEYFACTKVGGGAGAKGRSWCYDTRGNENWDWCTRCNLGMQGVKM